MSKIFKHQFAILNCINDMIPFLNKNFYCGDKKIIYPKNIKFLKTDKCSLSPVINGNPIMKTTFKELIIRKYIVPITNDGNVSVFYVNGISGTEINQLIIEYRKKKLNLQEFKAVNQDTINSWLVGFEAEKKLICGKTGLLLIKSGYTKDILKTDFCMVFVSEKKLMKKYSKKWKEEKFQ